MNAAVVLHAADLHAVLVDRIRRNDDAVLPEITVSLTPAG
jgi:hypothetical protein